MDWDDLSPSQIGLFILSIVPKKVHENIKKSDYLLLLAEIGDREFVDQILRGESISIPYYLKKWEDGARRFREKIDGCLLYP